MKWHHDMEGFNARYERGKEGKNLSIPMGFRRLTRYVGLRRQMFYLIGGFTGCLSGDTIVYIARKQRTANTNRYTLETLYNKLHRPVKRDGWNLDLPTRIKVFKPDLEQTSLHYMDDIVYSGVKELYEVTTSSNKKIEATEDHKFMVSESGEFKKLKDLKLGDEVLCKAPKHSRKKGRKLRHRKEICGKYPYYWGSRKREINGQIYQRFYDYRLIYDAGLNNIAPEELLRIVRTEKRHKLILSNPKWVIHHIDENPLNNNLSNLILLPKEEHDKLHAKTSNFGNSWVQLEEIISIKYIGKKPTFDIICDDPYHNFIANDFVVSNSGKTTLVDDAFVLNPSTWWLEDNKDKSIDFKILYFSMERSKDYKIARWLSRVIFLREGKIIPVGIIVGWDRPPNTDEQYYIDKYTPWINRLFVEIITMFDGPINPTGIYKAIKDFAEPRGTIEEVVILDKNGKEFKKKIYKPHNPNEMVFIIVDTINLSKQEKKEDGFLMNKKEAVDKTSEYLRHARDHYGYSPVAVSQFNREIADPMRLKAGDVQPRLEDFSDTSATQNDAEVVMALFDPNRYHVDDIYGYKLDKLKEKEGNPMPGSNKYRQLSILKNNYGADAVGVGLAYQPQCGLFMELPYPKDMNEEIYNSVLDNSFFLQ